MMNWLQRALRSPQNIVTTWFVRHSASTDPYEDCPLCRNGRLSTLPLMDVMACDFCQHLFSIDTSQPLVKPLTLRLEDGVQPLSWQWNGEKWMALSQANAFAIRWLWSLCLLIVLLPSMLMGLMIQILPTADGNAWFPFVWFGLTFVLHGLISLWLLAEHYQWPLYTRFKLAWARLRFE